jgi:serine protease AprX
MPTRPRSVLHAILWALSVAVIIAMTSMPAFAQASDTQKLDAVLQSRLSQLRGRSRVIVKYTNLEDVRAITAQSGRVRRRLAGERAHVADVDNLRLLGLAADPRVARVMVDRAVFPTTFRTGAASGAALVRQDLGVTGRGVGIAVIDSGISAWQDEIAAERVVYFKDFTREADDPLASQLSDEYGHGTHVASIAAGAGADGRHVGMAPGAHLIGFKVIDGDGVGYISDVIDAVDEAIRLKDAYAIRIINLSVASGVFESYKRDPLTLAAERAFDAGIVVVAAAGNLGQNDEGWVQFGGVTSPGNAPWVLTVGATTHQGTAVRNDDAVAAFSSRGPTWIDFAAKPDLVAPGVGIEASAAPGSTLAAVNAEYLVGTPAPGTGLKPYLSMSGTSMAAPVVAGTVALMLEANPNLTPNAVKGILQYTAQRKEDESPLAQGAGMLNAFGAVRLARFFSAPTTELGTVDVIEGEPVAWSREMIWGNYRISGGVPLPGANAWTDGLTWGSMQLGGTKPVVWGARIANDDGVALELVDDALVLATADRRNIVWATGDRKNIVWATGDRSNIVWATGDRKNIVWATGDRSNIVWATGDRKNIVWATGDRSNIVWATGDRKNIVWATGDRKNIVWATGDRNNIVWATALGENVVWGTDCDGNDCQRQLWGSIDGGGDVWGTAQASDNVLWSLNDRRNIVWATGDRTNIVWATGGRTNIVWATADRRNIVWATNGQVAVVWATGAEGDEAVWTTATPPAVVWADSH